MDLTLTWTCDDCGIQHQHPPGEAHDLSSEVMHGFVDELACNPECNCGWTEAAERIESGELDVPWGIELLVTRRAKHMPVPESVR